MRGEGEVTRKFLHSNDIVLYESTGRLRDFEGRQIGGQVTTLLGRREGGDPGRG